MRDSNGVHLLGLDPIEGERARVLILGSMPGRVSLDAAEYYAHPRNAFWNVMQRLGIDRGASYAERCRLVTERGIALWDVARTCIREGSLDAHIRAAEPNDFAGFGSRHAELGWMLFNGKKARELYDKQVEAPDGVELITLPSTSPANTQQGKVEAWLAVLNRALGAR